MTELIRGHDTAVRARSVCTAHGMPPSRTAVLGSSSARAIDTAACCSSRLRGADPAAGPDHGTAGTARDSRTRGGTGGQNGCGSQNGTPVRAAGNGAAAQTTFNGTPALPAAAAAVTVAHRVAEPTAEPGFAAGAASARPVIDPAAVEAGIVAMWRSFGDNRSPANRDRLVLHYAPLVKYVAGRIGTGLPAHVELCDLVQSGIFGLVDAITRFEPDRGLKFETYAMQRIRGAILDDLRAQDWVPRSVRSRAREVERAMERLEASLQRSATEAELADEVGITVEDLRDFFAQFQLTSVAALDELVATGRGAGSLAETLADHHAEDPVAAIEDRENRRLLAEAIAQLGDRDRSVVTLYYFENLTLAEIGKVLGVTESRVCQLHTRAVLRLRTKLNDPASL